MSTGWIKLHRAAADHPCLQRLDALGVWSWLLMRAARRPRRVIIGGQAISLQPGQLAVSVAAFSEKGDVTRKRMRSILGLFRANGMIEMGQGKGHAFTLITICNYDEYQGTSDEQVQGEGQLHANEGPTKGQGRANEGPTEQERKNLGESESSLRSDSSPEPKPKRRKVALGCRIPEGWKPSDADREYARKHGFDEQRIGRAAENFVNYWQAKPGKDGLKCDWSATWRNRVLQIVEFSGGPSQPPPERRAKIADDTQRRRAAEAQCEAEGYRRGTSEGLARVAEILRDQARAA